MKLNVFQPLNETVLRKTCIGYEVALLALRNKFYI